MKRMKELNETLFKAICLCFSACMLVLSLLTTIDAAAQREQQDRLQREIQALSAENESLRSRVEAELGRSWACSPADRDRSSIFKRRFLEVLKAPPCEYSYYQTRWTAWMA